jgi:hypothetical protein
MIKKIALFGTLNPKHSTIDVEVTRVTGTEVY